jgi:hypothetical protein
MKGILLGMLLLVAGFSKAQQVQVEQHEQSVNGMLRSGQQLTVQLDPKTVEKLWKEHLSQKAGKVKYSKGVYTVEGAVIDTISKLPMRVLSTVESGATGSQVWWALDLGEKHVTKDDTPAEYEAAENFLRGFARKAYRADVLRQINNAQDVLLATKAEQERVLRQAHTYQQDIEKNKKRKQELEAALVRNAEELKQLETDVQNNIKQQEASRRQVEELEKAVEAVRAKLSRIK